MSEPFDFDTVIDRRHSHSIKWRRYGDDVLPMWVADMDFASPAPVLRALQARIAHGVFGYEGPHPDLIEAIVAWLARRYGWQVSPEAIVLLPGLVSGLNLVCRAYGYIGDHVVMLTPVYPPFLTAPPQQGLVADQVPLRPVADGPRWRYEIDDEAFCAAIGPRTRIFLHCHPHNPVGRDYTPAELERLAAICLERDVLIVSDEIHADLTLNGQHHTPMAALAPAIAERCVTLMAPSKTFNLPGLGCSFAVVTNPRLRARLEQAAEGIVPHVNALGMIAARAAYTEGEAWLTALLAYLRANREALLAFVDEHMPAIRCTVPEATYLAWLDCRQADLPGNPYRFFLDKARVATQNGTDFGRGGEGFIRFNFGCPRSLMLEALERMAKALHHR
jgi:cystathionine beta-lyase